MSWKSSCHVTSTLSSKDTSLLPTSISLLYNSLLPWISSSLQPSHISSLKQHLSTLSGSLSSKSPIKQKEYCYHTLRVQRRNNGAIGDEVLIQWQRSPFDLLLSVTRTAKSKKSLSLRLRHSLLYFSPSLHQKCWIQSFLSPWGKIISEQEQSHPNVPNHTQP